MSSSASTSTNRTVAYVVSEELVKAASALPSNLGRSSLVHSLANALGFFKGTSGPLPNLKALRPRPASVEDLCSFHDSEFIDFLMRWKGTEDEEAEAEEWGLEHDCPYFDGMARYAQLLGGAVLDAVKLLKSGQAQTAVVWDGGRHHASKSKASGYCYINDCNLAILSLRRMTPRPRVMYIDLDLHFSDGVSEAFLNTSSTPSVLTFSIHHAAPGFYPISPLSSLSQSSTAHPFNISVPLHEGASNATLARIWENCVEKVKGVFQPDFVVLQVGVDGLAEDSCAVWNLGLDVESKGSFGWIVDRVRQWDVRTLILGGGGYNSPNAARAWAYLTSVACGHPLPIDTPIPDHPAFPQYAPSFTLDVAPGNRVDLNTDEYLEEVEENVAEIVSRLESFCAT